MINVGFQWKSWSNWVQWIKLGYSKNKLNWDISPDILKTSYMSELIAKLIAYVNCFTSLLKIALRSQCACILMQIMIMINWHVIVNYSDGMYLQLSLLWYQQAQLLCCKWIMKRWNVLINFTKNEILRNIHKFHVNKV